VATLPQTEGMLSVSALTQRIKEALEVGFPAVWVKGELTGVKRAPSGHLYFSLKDPSSQLDCVMWKGTFSRLGFEPRDGAEVEAFGDVTVYAARGRYQLTVRELRPAGLGALLLALEQLKRALQAEGLFDPARKRPLPRYPMRIGLVTSPIGAAVRDMVKVLRARWPSIAIVLAPVRVQGEGAAQEIAAAIERFNRLPGVDLLIVGRGGGSIEDLWAFNEEVVVRAVAGSAIPVIAAVGHEVDWTLTDLAADVRAATPSNAAEIAVRVRDEVRERVSRRRADLAKALAAGMDERRRRLEALLEKYGFRRQRDALGLHLQRIDDFVARLAAALGGRLERARDRLGALLQRYGLREWPRAIERRREQAAEARARLLAALVEPMNARRTRLLGYQDRLRALSPRLVLERGYCLARRADGTLVRSALGLATGELLGLEFARGEADARIEAVRPGGRNAG
jgi:exodeoxyribonuclease VII large subunit